MLVCLSCRYADMKLLISCVQAQAKKKNPNVQPLQQETLYICLSSPPAELFFSLSPSFFSLKRSSSRSFSQRKRDTLEMRWRRERAQCSSKYVLSALCIISTTTFTSDSTHLSEQTPPPQRQQPPPVYTLHTTSCIHQSGGRAGRQTWKAHSYNGGSIRLGLGRRRQGRRDSRPSGEGGAAGGFIRAVIMMQGIPERVLARRQSEGTQTQATTNNTHSHTHTLTPLLGAVMATLH